MNCTQDDLTSQSDLADLLDVSQAWLSEATRDGKIVAGGEFDPEQYAVYDGAGTLRGYDVDEDDLPASSGRATADREEGTGQDSNASMAPATATKSAMALFRPSGRALATTTGGYRVDNRRVDRSHSEHHEKTTVSVVPEGTSVSEAGGYAAAGYAASTAVQANPAAVPMLMNIFATGAGALIGYKVTNGPSGALWGSLIGLIASESGRQLSRRAPHRQSRLPQRGLVLQHP